MLNLKSVVFKIAVLPPQSCKLTTASPQCAIQKNQQLIPEFKLGQTQLDLLRRSREILLPYSRSIQSRSP